jgi:Brp/Blh family beta-carotene 15,15'-monooxygenase
MSKSSNFSIVASFVGLWLNSFFNEEIQIVIGFILIFSFGILHGANDLLLIDKNQSKYSTNSFYKILFYYILVVISGAFLFYYLPTFALSLFIIVSGYHFGEQHWQSNLKGENRKLQMLFHLSYGLFILSLLFVFHIPEIQRIVSDISNTYVPAAGITLFFYFCLIIFLAITLVNYLNNKAIKQKLIQELLFLFVFAIIFKTSSLIWGFTIYFIIWHSIPSMFNQINYLYGTISLDNFIIYFKSAFLYWIISLIGISLLVFIFQKEHYFDAMFFSFLAAITFPHVWVILKMFKKHQTT